MTTVAGYVVRFSYERQRLFDQQVDTGDFAEAVPDFIHSRNVPLVCFVVNEAEILSHICLGSRGQKAGTGLRRLNMTKFFSVTPEVSIVELVQRISNRNRPRVDSCLRRGGLLTPKAFESLIAAIIELSPGSAAILNRYREERRIRIDRLPQNVRQVLAEQKEAVGVALTIAGIDRKELSGWDFDVETGPTSFIDGLPSARLREDQMVVNDLSVLPGYEELQSSIHGSAVFENDQSRLTVILANRLPLEQQTGADLIYYNETFKCFLMVQYKAMEQEGGEAKFRFPNEQLTEEIRRMDLLISTLSTCARNSEADGFRLNENPFFLKFCPRLVFNPDSSGLSPGMYLPLDYWKLLSQHPSLGGSRGGRSLSFRNVRRYFDNSNFVGMAAGGWVGTNIHQSSILRDAIRNTLESGRAAVIAVNREMDDRHRRVSLGEGDN